MNIKADSIQIYQRTEYITKEIKMVTKPKRWGIGLQAGYGVTIANFYREWKEQNPLRFNH